MSEIHESLKGLESGVIIARLQNQYLIHDWKIEQAKRISEFLKIHKTFTREELKLWIYREYYLFNLKKRETPFVKKLLSLMLEELEFEGFIGKEDKHYKVLKEPSIEDILRILQMQKFDLWF
jgi:hypothetical protein